jgi:uncharacterized protein (TIGR02271 family)
MSENPANSKSAETSSSPGEAVVDWDRIIHKNVRTLDDQGMGKVIAVPNDEDVLIIASQSGGEQYKIPKSCVMGFNGAEVLLNETAYKIMSSSYRVDNMGAYEAKSSQIITGGHQQEEETIIPLIEERLNVSKRTSTNQYTITKEPVTEKKTIEVPVTHEELVVEKRPAKEASPSVHGPVKSRTEIKVPLNREQVEVTKESFVKEEVVVKKKQVTETKTVSDTLKSERINILGIATGHNTSIASTQE